MQGFLMTDVPRLFDRAIRPLAWALEQNHKSLIGVNNTMGLARLCNRLRHGRGQAERERACREFLAVLLAENAAAQGEGTVDTGVELQDGWVVDASQTLPHMERHAARGQRGHQPADRHPVGGI